MFKPSSILKYILGIFLFGLVFLANPIEGYCYTNFGYTQYIPNGTTLPYSYVSFIPDQLGTNSPSSYYHYGAYALPFDTLPVTTDINGHYSFDYNFSFNFFNTFRSVDCSGSLLFTFQLNYTDSDNITRDIVVYSSFGDFYFSNDHFTSSVNFSFPVNVQGRLNFMRLYISLPYYDFVQPFVFSAGDSLSVELQALNSSSNSYSATITGTSTPNYSGSFSGSASGTLIEPGNSGTWSGSNDSGTWSEDYWSSQNSGTWQAGNGVNSGVSGSLSLPTNSFNGTVTLNSSAPDYSGSIEGENIDPSGSRFMFVLSATTTNFVNYYESDFNDSLNGIESYTSTLVDQFDDFFDYVAPNTQSFNADKSTTDSMIQSASSIQNGYFDSLTSAVGDTGLDSYDFAEYNPQVNYVSGLLTDVYDTFPNKVKYVIYFVLFLGMFSVLINAVAYVVKKG